MPVYNGAKYISESINSVLTQSYTDWELVIINDGSTDKSDEVIGPYLKDNRIKYVKQENSGVVKSRNRGVELASGEYIAFLDADDIWLAGKLEQQNEILKQSAEPIFICSNFQYIDDSNKELGEFFGNKSKAHQGWVAKYLLEDNFILTSSVVMPKNVFEKLGGYNEDLNLKVGEDHELWLRVACTIKLACLETVLVHYRVHKSQSTKNKLNNYRHTLKLYIHIFSNIKKYPNIQKTDVIIGFTKRVLRILF